MSDRPAGWYPDPDGENRQRYWDGDSWTGYYTPLAPPRAEIHGAATATTDYPYLAATRGQHPDVMVRAGAPALSTGGWPTATPGAADDGTMEFTGAGRRPPSSRWFLVTVSVLVVALVVVLGVWALGGAGGNPSPGPTATGPTGPVPTSTGDPIALDASTTGDVGGFGLWTSALSLDADTLLSIDVRADASGADLEITLTPSGGGSPVGNDDRGSALANTSGNALDPYLVASLPAGDYDVAVTNRNGGDTGFDLTTAAITTELPLGQRLDATVPENDAWAGYVTIDSDADYRVDVVGESADDGDTPDPVLVLVGPDGEQLVNDDRDAGDPDPQLVQQLTAGTWVVVVIDYRGRSIDISVEVGTA